MENKEDKTVTASKATKYIDLISKSKSEKDSEGIKHKADMANHKAQGQLSEMKYNLTKAGTELDEIRSKESFDLTALVEKRAAFDILKKKVELAEEEINGLF